MVCQGYTAVLVACQAGNLDLATFLVSRGADLSVTTARGMSALHLAAEKGKVDLIQTLVAAGVSAENLVKRKFGKQNISTLKVLLGI